MCRFPETKLCLLALVLTTVAQAEVVVGVLETDPPAPAVLGKTEWVNIRLAYTSDQEVMFSPDSFFKGRRVSDENYFLVSGFRPAGSGEAAVAIAFLDPRKVDVVKIFAWSRSGGVIAQTSFPVDLTWAGRAKATIRPTPDWAHSLKEQQRDLARKAAAQEKSTTWIDDLGGVLLSVLMFGSVPAYLLLQATAFWRLRGGWLSAALVPIIPMIMVFMYTIGAYNKQSNLWPMVLILTSPLASVYLLALLIIDWFGRKLSGK